MKRLAWITDVHLNFLDPPEVEEFFRTVSDTVADAVLLSGDVGEARDAAVRLNALHTAVGRPVYFVLGNHDFYRGSIAGLRSKIECSARRSPTWCGCRGPASSR